MFLEVALASDLIPCTLDNLKSSRSSYPAGLNVSKPGGSALQALCMLRVKRSARMPFKEANLDACSGIVSENVRSFLM